MKRNYTVDVVNGTLLLLVAAGLRIFSLKIIYADIDELFQIYTASRTNLHDFFAAIHATGPQQYLLDYVVGSAATKITTSIYLLRFVPIFWSLLAVALTYIFGRTISGRPLAWLWAWLMAVSTLHIEYAQTFRPYSLMVFLALLSTFSFFLLLRRGASLRGYLGSTCAFQLIYPFSAIKSGIDIFCARHQLSRKTRVLMALPLVIPIAHWALMGHELISNGTFAFAKKETIGGLAIQHFVWRFNQFNPVVVVSYSLLAGVGFLFATKNSAMKNVALYGSGLIAAVLGALFLFLYSAHMPLYPRFAIPILPLYLGFVAFGATELIARIVKRVPLKEGAFLSLMSVVTCATLLGAHGSLSRYLAAKKDATESLYANLNFLSKSMRANDTIVFSNPNTAATYVYDLDRFAFLQLPGITISHGFNMFYLPPTFHIESAKGQIPIFAVAKDQRGVATIDKAKLFELKQQATRNRGTVWFVDSDLNYFSEECPFYQELNLNKQDLQPVFNGIFLLK